MAIGADADPRSVMLVANNWCPQHCISSSKNPGYLVEIAQAALAASHVNSTIEFEPWLRAVRNVKMGIYDGLLTPTESEYINLIRHKEPLAKQRFCFYSKLNKNNHLTSLADFKGKEIAISRGSNPGNEFMKFVLNAQNQVSLQEVEIGTGDYALRTFRILFRRNFDAISITEDMGDYYLANNPALSKKIQKGYCSPQELLHVGLSPVAPERSRWIGKQLDHGLEVIKNNGVYISIMRKYKLDLN